MPQGRSPDSRTRADDHYLDFVKSVQLMGVGVDSASFRIDRERFIEDRPEGERVNAEISGGHEVVRRPGNSFQAIGRYRVVVKGKSGADLMQIECTFSALLGVENLNDESFLHRFAENEARIVFWPYVRHFVADSTYRMGISPLLLPLISTMTVR